MPEMPEGYQDLPVEEAVRITGTLVSVMLRKSAEAGLPVGKPIGPPSVLAIEAQLEYSEEDRMAYDDMMDRGAQVPEELLARRRGFRIRTLSQIMKPEDIDAAFNSACGIAHRPKNPVVALVVLSDHADTKEPTDRHLVADLHHHGGSRYMCRTRYSWDSRGQVTSTILTWTANPSALPPGTRLARRQAWMK